MGKTKLAKFLRLAGTGTKTPKRPERVGKKGFVVYLDPELLHQVKTVALAERKTLQEIGVEALERLVDTKHPAADQRGNAEVYVDSVGGRYIKPGEFMRSHEEQESLKNIRNIRNPNIAQQSEAKQSKA